MQHGSLNRVAWWRDRRVLLRRLEDHPDKHFSIRPILPANAPNETNRTEQPRGVNR